MFIKRKSSNLFKKSAEIALKGQKGGKIVVKKTTKEEEKPIKKQKTVVIKAETDEK